MIFLAISRWQPIASIVTIAPSIASMARSFRIAMISLDFSATLTWPRTRRWRAAKAKTIWIAALPQRLWPDRRMGLPSLAITPAATPLSAATPETKSAGLARHRERPECRRGDRGPRAVPERAEAAQEVKFLHPEQGDLGDARGASQHGKQA